MVAARDLVSLNRPAARDYESVSNYVWNTRPLCDDEEDWIRQKEDLITLRLGREHAWLDTAIEHMLKALNYGWINVRARLHEGLELTKILGPLLL
jgi:hypothetical protein